MPQPKAASIKTRGSTTDRCACACACVCVCVCVCVGDMQYSATIKTEGSTTDRVCRLSEEEEEEETDLVSVLNIF